MCDHPYECCLCVQSEVIMSLRMLVVWSCLWAACGCMCICLNYLLHVVMFVMTPCLVVCFSGCLNVCDWFCVIFGVCACLHVYFICGRLPPSVYVWLVCLVS